MSGPEDPNIQRLAANQDYVPQIHAPCCVLDSPQHRITTFSRAVSNSIPLTWNVLREERFLTRVNLSVVLCVIFSHSLPLQAQFEPCDIPHQQLPHISWEETYIGFYRLYRYIDFESTHQMLVSGTTFSFITEELAFLHYGVLYPWSIWRRLQLLR